MGSLILVVHRITYLDFHLQ